MKSKEKCKACGKLDVLEEHHVFPQRMRPIWNQSVYICKKCHKRIHPENEIILRVKKADYHLKVLTKFLKSKYIKAYEEWEPFKNKVNHMFDDKINNCLEK